MAGLIRVAVVDDHPATAEGLASLLAASADVEVVGTARDIACARDLIRAATPDVVLCDIELGGGDRGFELLATQRPGEGAMPAVVFFSAYDYPAFRALAMEGGASGYLLKTAPMAEILDAIQTAAAGGTMFTAHDLRAARSGLRPPSERELEVIGLIVAGRSNEEIAAQLGIGPKTVESHLRRLFARYSVYNRTSLAMLAVRQGWIDQAER